jgi:histone acetyltransferase (RNA polymerase elongator complex component)
MNKTAKPLIIPIFVMNKGCPHRCIFCNQKITAGSYPETISRDFFEHEVNSYLNWNKDKSRRVEIAFYGGSFTGMKQPYQEELLSLARACIEKGLVHSLRVSTRPDYINPYIISFLQKYNVTTVEIGAQSFDDDVLQRAQRGHSAIDSINAIHLLQEVGMKTGLHLMVGLPGDSEEGFNYSLQKTIELKPDTVRIHPVVILRDTALADEFQQGNYQPLSLTEAVRLCRSAWIKLSTAGIRVIRTGLQITKEMEREEAILGGPAHPAFGNLVLSAVFYEEAVKLLNRLSAKQAELRFELHDQDISTFRGWRSNNIKSIKNLFPLAEIDVGVSAQQKRGVISLSTGQGQTLHAVIPGIA